LLRFVGILLNMTMMMLFKKLGEMIESTFWELSGKHPDTDQSRNLDSNPESL